MTSVEEMPITIQQMNRKQRRRAGIYSNGSPHMTTERNKMPRLEGHRKRVHWEVKPS
jgi:hypothetical protein